MSQAPRNVDQRSLAREKQRLTWLTVAASLDGVLLTLISAQFVAPQLFIALLALAPAVFALEAQWMPLWVTLESGALVVLVATALYGPGVGLWAGAYVVAGMVTGLGRKYRVPALARVVALALALLALIAAVVAALFWLGGVTLAQAEAMARPWLAMLTTTLGPSLADAVAALMAVSLAVLLLLLAGCVELVVWGVTRRLPVSSLAGD